MEMRRVLASVALGAAVATGSTVAMVGPAYAASVSCSTIGFRSSNGGNAWASGCSHSATRQVRLYGECDYSLSTVYSPWVEGSFTSRSFSTPTCTFGVNEAGFGH
jgi:hypothetical protein